MPLLEITFSGSCAFVIDDHRKVDVYFVNAPSGGHVHDQSHLHVPILTSERGTIASTDADGPSVGRSTGLPIYLARFATSRFSLDEAELKGPVQFSTSADPSQKPASPNDWEDLAYCLDLSALLPTARLDTTRALPAALHVMSLRGGELKGAVPSQQLGDTPWIQDGAPAGSTGTFVTDTVVYQFEYAVGKLALSLQHPQRGRVVKFARGRDVRLSVVHEPFLVTLATGPQPTDLSHLGAVFQAFSGTELPRDAVLRQATPATPDPTYCPPGRVRKGA